MIHNFRRVVCEEGLSAMDDFPYPTAAYRQDGTSTYVNRIFLLETGMSVADLLSGSHNILGRITDANRLLLDAVEQVFLAKLSGPMDIFISEKTSNKNISSRYQSAILFLVSIQSGMGSLGAVIFMEEFNPKQNRIMA